MLPVVGATKVLFWSTVPVAKSSVPVLMVVKPPKLPMPVRVKEVFPIFAKPMLAVRELAL